MGFQKGIHLRHLIRQVYTNSRQERTSFRTSSSSVTSSSSLSSSSSLASSIANGVRSMNARCAAASYMVGIGENNDDSDFVDAESGRLRSAGADADVVGTVTALSSEDLRLAFDTERRIVGVSKDSLALGSSRAVNLPMAGRWKT